MRAPEARAKILLYFVGKPHFDVFRDQKMGATVAPMSKKLGANPKRWGPLAPWPPLISIAGKCMYTVQAHREAGSAWQGSFKRYKPVWIPAPLSSSRGST